MSNKNYELVLQSTLNAVFKNVAGDLRVNCAQRIVKQIDVSLRVNSSGQTDPRLLSTRNIDASFSDYCFLPFLKLLDIMFKLGRLECFVEELFVVDFSEEDVVFDAA